MKRFTLPWIVGSPLIALLFSVTPVAFHARPAAADVATPAGCSVDLSQMSLDPEEQAVLDQTNAYRAANGLQPLQPEYALTQNALWKSTDMASANYFAHDDPSRSWMQRFSDCGYPLPGMTIGENLAAGNASGTATLVQWQNSPEHNQNLLNPRFTAIGIKRVKSTRAGDEYGWYWAMELGSSVDYSLNAWLDGQ